VGGYKKLSVRQEKHLDKASGQTLRHDLIDIVALTAAVAWFVILVLLSWSIRDIPLLEAIERGLIGSIIIYVVVFVAFHMVIRAALRTEQKLRKEKMERLINAQGEQSAPVPNRSQEQE
jgi:uncharacterized membrane protein